MKEEEEEDEEGRKARDRVWREETVWGRREAKKKEEEEARTAKLSDFDTWLSRVHEAEPHPW